MSRPRQRCACTTLTADSITDGNGFVWLTQVEIKRIAKHLKLSTKKFLAQYCRTVDGQISLNEHCNVLGQYDCTFLTNPPTGKPGERCARGCAIYSVRPTQCRTWPFWPENLTDKKAWDRAAKGCRGMNQGTHYSAERIETLRTATDWPEDPPTSVTPQTPGPPTPQSRTTAPAPRDRTSTR